MREPQGALAFAGDWHGNDFWATSAVHALRELHNVDTILHTGDFGLTFTDIDDAEYIKRLEHSCASNGVMIYFVDGNHDNHPWLWSRPIDENGLYIVSEHIRCIPRGFRWSWWDRNFIGIGGAVSPDRYMRREGVSWWLSEELTDAEVETICTGGPADIWLSHDCPSFVNIPGIEPGKFGGFPPELIALSMKHRDKLTKIFDAAQPSVIVHGHYHRQYQKLVNREGLICVIGLNCDGSHLYENCFVINSPKELANLTTT